MHLGVCMVKRTTILLDDDVYEMLVRESIKRYGTTRALFKVLNELVRKALASRQELLELIYSEKIVNVSEEKFSRFRRELNKRLTK